WWLLIISAVLPALVAGFYVSRQPDFYQARATLMVGTSLQNPDPDLRQLNLANNLANAYARLVREGPVTQAVIARLGLDRGPGQLASQISTQVYPEAQLLEIRVVDTDPRLAALIANALADELVQRSPVSQEDQQRRQQFIKERLDELEVRIEQLDEDIAQLQDSLVELTSAAELEEARRHLQELETARANFQETYAALLGAYRAEMPNMLTVFEPAAEPTAPLPRRAGLVVGVAAVAGLVLAVAGILVIELLDDAVRWDEVQEERELMGLPILGVLPRVRVGRSPLAHRLRFRMAEVEAIRSARTSFLLSIGERRPVVVLVTSPAVGDGKTFTVVSLGMSLAAMGMRVMLVDGNLRNPGLHEWFDQPNVRGLAELLSGASQVPASWPPVEVRPTEVNNLYLLPAGRPPADPTAVLANGRVDGLLETLKRYADVVLIDSPASASLPDAVLLVESVDNVVVVCRDGHTPAHLLQQLIELFQARTPQKPLEIIFNRVKVNRLLLYPAPGDLEEEQRADGRVVLTTAEAAELLGVRSATVRRWCRMGKLPAERVRWRWLIRREDLDRFSAAILEVEEIDLPASKRAVPSS
ncbi:MAG TPA: helix-turn-helix domain-containing protein, partial [Chloroflexi bacterium]|nr:helix-turn-helix domain-containing protein [Chloroflexota bacterium]